MHALLLTTDGAATDVEVPDESREQLPFLQRTVEGYIDRVPYTGALDIDIWVNDEGAYTHSRNPSAEDVTGYPAVYGPAVVTGSADADGEITALSADARTAVCAHARTLT